MLQTLIYVAKTDFLKDEKVFKKFYDVMMPYRKNKIDFYKDPQDKCLSLGAGLILSYALKKAGLKEESLEYAYKESGMPYFKNQKDIYFSIAHSVNCVVCGLSLNCIGVDVEKLNNKKDVDIDYWVKIESYAKATDTSMADLLSNKVTFSPKYIFKEYKGDSDCKIMICSPETISESQIITLEQKDF